MIIEGAKIIAIIVEICSFSSYVYGDMPHHCFSLHYIATDESSLIGM